MQNTSNIAIVQARVDSTRLHNKIFLKTQNIGEVIALLLNKEDDIWYGIAKIKFPRFGYYIN